MLSFTDNVVPAGTLSEDVRFNILVLLAFVSELLYIFVTPSSILKCEEIDIMPPAPVCVLPKMLLVPINLSPP